MRVRIFRVYRLPKPFYPIIDWVRVPVGGTMRVASHLARVPLACEQYKSAGYNQARR